MDYAHNATDKILDDLEKRLAEEYRKASREMEKKLQGYLDQFAAQDAVQKQLFQDGQITAKEYSDWRFRHMMMNKRWEEMRNTLAADYHRANQIAAGIYRGERAGIYALNHNYALYKMEHDAGINTGLSLYNRDAVERMMTKDPQMLPPPGKKVSKRIAEGKDVRWNNHQIQSVMTQGILQGESIPKLARRLETVTEHNFTAAMRNARTMATGAQNAGRQEAYERAEALGVQLVKEWQATLDGRTRHDHRLLHGVRVPVDEPFQTDQGKLDFPGDPAGPPGEVYNCRCTTLSWVKGYEGDTVKDSPKMAGMSFEEWQNEKAKEEKREPEELSFAEKVSAIKDRLNGALPEESDILEAGKLVADDYKTESEEMARIHEEKTGQLRADYKNAVEELNNAEGQWWDAKVAYHNGEISKEEYQRYEDRLNKAAADKDNAYNLLHEAEKKYPAQMSPEKSADWLAKKIGETREVGVGDLDIKSHLNNSHSKVVPNIQFAYQRYPKDWVEKSVAKGNLTPRLVSRGHYSEYNAELYISGSGRHATRTAFHELGHRFEDVVPGISSAEKAFFDRRTAGCDTEYLYKIFPGYGYGKGEKTKRDNFLHPYMGKSYTGGKYYELVSMGFEEAYMSPQTLAGDPDMQAWIYGLLLLI